jgi:hypothetical protein
MIAAIGAQAGGELRLASAEMHGHMKTPASRPSFLDLNAGVRTCGATRRTAALMAR